MVSKNRYEWRKCSSGAAKKHKKIYKEDIWNTWEGSLEKFVVAKSAPYEEEEEGEEEEEEEEEKEKEGEVNNLCFRENGYTTREANITLVNIAPFILMLKESIIIPSIFYIF
jgi:CO dehydrogenase/acetyl-CoA synthase beta subunit